MLLAIKEDLYRYVENYSTIKFVKTYFLIPGFRYMVWFRLHKHYNNNLVLSFLTKIILRKLSYKFGIQISPKSEIGRGFYIGHFNGIIVNGDAKIGDNVNISQGVTIGQTNRGKLRGTPKIGNKVYIGPGAIIVGNITIGDEVAIGGNCVVTSDIPEKSVVVGIPGKVISQNGSSGYINRTI